MFKFLNSLFLMVCFYSYSLIAGEGISLADDYKNNSGLQWDWAVESIEHFSFNPNDKILDVGCGDGKITALIAKQIQNGFVVGIDISEKMVMKASSLFSQQKNLSFIIGNAIEIPFREQFDKIVSFCTLHWILQQEQALNSMKDSLKPDGIMLLVLPGKAPNNIAGISEKLVSSEKWSAYFPSFKQERIYYTKNEYAALLAKSGLKIQSIKEADSITYYKDKKALITWIKPLVNFIDHLSLDLQEKFIEDIATEMIQNNPPLSDGSLGIHHTKIEVIATK